MNRRNKKVVIVPDNVYNTIEEIMENVYKPFVNYLSSCFKQEDKELQIVEVENFQCYLFIAENQIVGSIIILENNNKYIAKVCAYFQFDLSEYKNALH